MTQQQVASNRITSGREVGLRHESELSKPAHALSYRERDILTLAARGLSNERIADKLGISSRTVRCTLHHACTKLGARSRLEAVYTAVIQGSIALDEILTLDELILVFKYLGAQAIREVAKRLKQKQLDELVNLLAPFEPTAINKAARVLKERHQDFQLPALSSTEGYRRSS